MEINEELLKDILSCCHNGHGASVFEDDSVVQAISSNDVVAHSLPEGGWEYRIAYISNPDVTLEDLEYLLEEIKNV